MSKTATKIKYVYVELIYDKTTKQDVFTGLFKGFFERSNKLYFLVQGKKNCTTALNADFYKIMTIEVLEQDYKNMFFVTADLADQKEAMAQLRETYEDLLSAGFASKEGGKIIDVSKYVEVPDGYYNGVPAGSGQPAVTTGVNSAGAFAQNRQRYEQNKNANVNIYRQVPIKADPTPTLFERTTTKKPTKEALEALASKIDAIKTGEAVPKIPDLIGAVETDENSSTANSFEDDEYMQNWYGATGMV